GPDAERGGDGDDWGLPPADWIDEPHQEQEQRQRAGDEADRLEADAVDEQEHNDDEHLLPARPLPQGGERRALDQERLGDDAESKGADQDADPEEGEAGAGIMQLTNAYVATGPGHEGADGKPEQAAPELGVADHVCCLPRGEGSLRSSGVEAWRVDLR